MNILSLGVLLSSSALILCDHHIAHGGSHHGSYGKCTPQTICTQVYKSECSTNYEEKCETTPVTTHKEVCHDVDEVKLNSQCYNKYYKECYADNRSNKDIKKGNKKSKRSPVGILQAILLAQALSTRHPENEREDEERCIVFPRKICSQVPVKSVTKKCQQVADESHNTKCHQVPVTVCNDIPVQECTQHCL